MSKYEFDSHPDKVYVNFIRQIRKKPFRIANIFHPFSYLCGSMQTSSLISAAICALGSPQLEQPLLQTVGTRKDMREVNLGGWELFFFFFSRGLPRRFDFVWPCCDMFIQKTSNFTCLILQMLSTTWCHGTCIENSSRDTNEMAFCVYLYQTL